MVCVQQLPSTLLMVLVLGTVASGQSSSEPILVTVNEGLSNAVVVVHDADGWADPPSGTPHRNVDTLFAMGPPIPAPFTSCGADLASPGCSFHSQCPP